MLENKSCNNEEIQFVDCGCDLGILNFPEVCNDKILVIGVSVITASQLETEAEAMKKITEVFEDKNSILPFNLMKDSIEKIRIHNEFKEKPQKRNFVNKFNKNQHRKK